MKNTNLLFGLAILALTSCEHKDLCYDHAHTFDVCVFFDWRNAPEADPETMSAYLFPENDEQAQRYEYPNKTGGSAAIPANNYLALCLNTDTEVNLLRNTDDADTFEIYTREAKTMKNLGTAMSSLPRAEDTETEIVVLTPEMIWSDRIDNITVACNAGNRTIVFHPSERLCTYTVEIRNVKNLQYASSMSGLLSGMGGSMLLAQRQLIGERCTLPFDVTRDGIDCVKGQFNTFGHCPVTVGKHQMTVYVILTDNTKWYYTWDVTEQIHLAADQCQIDIVLDGLELPEPEDVGGGFHPDVDDWKNIQIEITM